jgi:hypothetical protein
MHGSQHACDETVDTVALLHQGNQSGDLALVIVTASEMHKDELLEGFDLVLECHQVADSFVTKAEPQYRPD